MANEWYTSDQLDIQVAKKMALPRNADAKLEAADVLPSDELIQAQLFEPGGIAEPVGPSNIYVQAYQTSRYDIGVYNEILGLQTARNLYPALGKCVTTEATPNIHDMLVRTGQAPVNMGRHLQFKNETAGENDIVDVFGMLLNSYHAECSQRIPKATQSLSWFTTFTKNTSNDLITPAALTDEPYKWEHFTFPTFTYGGETIEATIMGWAFDVFNTPIWASLDSTDFYTIHKYIPPTVISTTLEIIPYGKNAKELIRTVLESYATDLDLVVKCARNVTTDFIQWSHDKLYANKFTIAANKTPGSFESYFLRMIQLNTGALGLQAKDVYNNNYYENP